MTEKHLFVVSAIVSLSTIVSLIWGPENKSWLWRKTMFFAFVGYSVGAMLAWLNQYTVPDLYPFGVFAYVTLFMMVLIALNYYITLRTPEIEPEVVLGLLSSQPETNKRIDDYRERVQRDQQRKQRTGVFVATSGIFLIVVAYAINHSFGLAENIQGNQEGFSKVLVKLVSEVRALNAEVRNLQTKLDITGKAVRANGGRIGSLENRNYKADKRDSLNTLKLLRNQNRMLKKAPFRSSPVQPIAPGKPWWKIGYQTPSPPSQWEEQPVEYQHPE